MRLVVIAKSPVPGRSKTRLCPPCSPEQAARVAEAALEDTLDACRDAAVELVLALEGTPGAWAAGFRVIPQRGFGLDERIANAFRDAGPDPDGSLLIGMDTPQVDARLLGSCMDALRAPGVDGVLGPARDGGWWAMGLRHPTPAHVIGVPMSSSHTLSEQRTRWDELGVRRVELPELTDIDTFADALAVSASIPGSRTAGVVRDIARQPMVAAW
jgi:uncharacterized protein